MTGNLIDKLIVNSMIGFKSVTSFEDLTEYVLSILEKRKTLGNAIIVVTPRSIKSNQVTIKNLTVRRINAASNVEIILAETIDDVRTLIVSLIDAIQVSEDTEPTILSLHNVFSDYITLGSHFENNEDSIDQSASAETRRSSLQQLSFLCYLMHILETSKAYEISISEMDQSFLSKELQIDPNENLRHHKRRKLQVDGTGSSNVTSSEKSSKPQDVNSSLSSQYPTNHNLHPDENEISVKLVMSKWIDI